MKKILIVILVILNGAINFSYGSFIKSQNIFDANNIRANIWNTGVLFQNLEYNNTPGFEWPKNSGKNAIFTAGLSIAAFMNGNLRLAMCSYSGEYQPGYIDVSDPQGPVFKTNSSFRLYKVKSGDTQYSNPDYAAWGLMIPYGAPFDDKNNNGVFDLSVDKPGIPDAAQTIFISITDADINTHSPSEGFSGGTLPLYTEVHITMWGYDLPNLNNVIFLRYEIINKSFAAWNKTHFGLFCEPRIGNPSDDYIGCDSSLNLGYGYNADNFDEVYGENPPAVGLKYLKTPVYKNSQLGMTCFNFSTYESNNDCSGPPSSPLSTFNAFTGIKTDSTLWLNPTTQPPYQTDYCFSGNPEDSSGWTEYKGKIRNCRIGGSWNIIPSLPGERRFVMGTGSDSLNIQPFRKFNIVFAALIDRGVNNLNSVTKIKNLSSLVQTFYNQNFNFQDEDVSYVSPQMKLPETYELLQNYPNPFNPATSIHFYLPESISAKLTIYDINGKQVGVIVNQYLTKGEYEYQWDAAAYPSGIYFYRLETESYTQTKKMILVK